MASVNKVKCPCCLNEYLRTNKQINQVIKRSGVWSCRTCNTIRHNKLRSRKIGDKRVNKASGYIEIKTNQGWKREHVYIIENDIGRKLLPNELVHHKDHNKKNNKLGNLQLMTFEEHTKLHHVGLKRSIETVNNIKKAKLKYDITIINKAREMVKSGISQNSVSRELNISKMTISRAVRNLTYTG